MTNAIGTKFHVEIGGTGYICKFDSKNTFQRTYEKPFIDRSSVAVSHSEGDYGQYLVFTQRSWNQGEGLLTMSSGGESRYYTSSGVDVSGVNGGLTLLKGVTCISGGAGQPDFGTDDVIVTAGNTGIYVAWPTGPVQKYLRKYDGSAWDTLTTLPAATTALWLEDGLFVKERLFLAFTNHASGGSIRRSDNWAVDWSAAGDFYSMGTDGNVIYGAQIYTTGGVNSTHFLSAVPTAAAPATTTSASTDLDGSPVLHGLCSHAGTMYAISYVAGAEITKLYRFDGTNFVLWKNLPDGFKGQSLSSDGSVLYIGGVEKCAEGNYRGQIYYLAGASASESLGAMVSFGERDGTSNYQVRGLTPHGKSLYFPWSFYGGLGRYDSVNGGISRSYRQATAVAQTNPIKAIKIYNGDLYFLVKGSGANNTALYKTADTYVTSGQFDSSYVDFGLPSTEKLFTSLTIMTPTALAVAQTGNIAVSYSTNGKTGTWTLLAASLAALTADTDSDTGLYKYTLTLPGNGIKAHSLAHQLTITSNTSGDVAPVVTDVTTNAVTLVRSPGKTRPGVLHQFSVVIAKDCATINEAIERGLQAAKLANLRTLFENQTVTTLLTFAEPETTYNVLITNLQELALNYSTESKTYEATVTLETREV